MNVAIQGMLAATRRGLGSLKVVMATGLYKTAAGVVGERLLKEHSDGLRTYLTIQLRTPAAAQKALAAIEDQLEHGEKAELEKGPSRRAALFLAARNLIEFEKLFEDGGTEGLSTVPWEPTPPGREEGWGRALDDLRFGLGADEAEILSLHHAFGLTAADLAYVLGLEKSDVTRRIEAGGAFAKLLLEDVFEDDVPALDALIKDAFAVVPPTDEELAAARPKVVPLPAGTVLGDRYEVESVLGGGEFAYVYRARDVRVPGHTVALKLLHRVARTAAAREGAMRELSLIASAFHPSLVQFKDHGWFEERLWFVMPFYAGEMLLDRLERGPLEVGQALAHFERLARGLAALHAAGIRHQDIKPENIFLVELQTGAHEEQPEVLPILLDLGVASPNGEMALAGTPMYFPPEIAAHIFDDQCELPLTPKADVFALALSLLHSIEVPDLEGLEDLDVDAFLKRRVTLVPKGPQDRRLAFLSEHFASWLAPHPNDRPSAGEMADQIAAIRETLHQGRKRYLTPPKRLRPLLVAACFTGLLATVTMLTDAPSRPIATPVATAVAPQAPSEDVSAPDPTAPVANESDRVRLLRHRLQTEERRGEELEQALERLRRDALDLPATSEPARAESPAEDAPEAG